MKSLTHQDPSPPARRQPADPVRRCRRLRVLRMKAGNESLGSLYNDRVVAIELLKHVGDGYNEIVDIAHKVGSASMTAGRGRRAGQAGAGQGGQQLEGLHRDRPRRGRTPLVKQGTPLMAKADAVTARAGGRARARTTSTACSSSPPTACTRSSTRWPTSSTSSPRCSSTARPPNTPRRRSSTPWCCGRPWPSARAVLALAALVAPEPDPLDHRRHRRAP